jgi:ATP-dependent Lon protease
MPPAKHTPRKSARPRTKTLPVVPLAETVVYPESVAPLAITQPQAIELVEHLAATNASRIVLLTFRPAPEGLDGDDAALEARHASPEPADLYDVGTEASIHRVVRVPDGTLRLLVQGARRVRVTSFPTGDDPWLVARVTPFPDEQATSPDELAALTRQLQQVFAGIVSVAPGMPDELGMVAANVDDPGELCHLIASTLKLDVADRQDVLETAEVGARMRLLLRLAAHERDLAELGSKIQSEVHTQLSDSQREWFLRKQLEQIREELGEGGGDTVADLRAQLDAAQLPPHAREAADRELARLERSPEQGAEHGVIRGYLEWIASLPWNATTVDDLDLTHAREVLDAGHHGLDEVKERVLDQLAVAQLRAGRANGRTRGAVASIVGEGGSQPAGNGLVDGAILCLVGPPGVGKTSLGKSIAAALGRRFATISVGGVRDEAEIRGHRRTYVGALPGTVVRALRDAGSRNPVFMVDEIDKLGSDWRGDPSSAMLEVLDPEQNSAFRDHFLDLPFDLSGALFICTANRLDTVPPALRDRLEVLHLEGYVAEDKLAIARTHLWPRALREHGLTRAQVSLPATTMRAIIDAYTREAGVRELDRQLATIARKAARRIVEDPSVEKFTVAQEDLPELLGPRRHHPERRRGPLRPGVATGMAVTGAGGEVLRVEAVAVPGSGKLTITGQLGDVMEESARAALSWLRSTLSPVDVEARRFFAANDLHVHVPAGAVPKDGPSAGCCIATALASLVLGVPVRDDLAMTGELTLTGDVLPIGGVREKCLAARAAGLRHVLLPLANEGDLDRIPPQLSKGLTFHLADRIEQVLELALPAGERRDLLTAGVSDRDPSRPRARQRRASGAKVASQQPRA